MKRRVVVLGSGGIAAFVAIRARPQTLPQDVAQPDIDVTVARLGGGPHADNAQHPHRDGRCHQSGVSRVAPIGNREVPGNRRGDRKLIHRPELGVTSK